MMNDEVVELLKTAFDLKRQEKYKSAIEALYKALSLCPDNIEILLQVADLHFLLKNYDSSISLYEKVVEEHFSDVDVVERLVKSYLELFEFEKAKLLITKHVLSYPSEKAYMTLFNVLKFTDSYDDIIEMYDDKNLSLYKSVELDKMLSVAYLKLKRIDEALKILNSLYSSGAKNPDIKFYLAKALFMQKKYDKSLTLVKEFISDYPTAEAFNLYGEIEMHNTNYEKAVQLFLNAISIKKDDFYFYNLATAYFMMGWVNEAVEYYNKAILLSPDSSEYRYSLAYLYYKTSQNSKALEQLEIVLSHCKKHQRANVLKAYIYLDQNKIVKAEKILLSLKLDTNDEQILLLSGKINKYICKYELAKDIFERLTQLNPNSLEYHSELADVLISLKNVEQAKNILKKCLVICPKYYEAYLLLSQLELDEANLEKALSYVNKALDLSLNNAQAYYLKAKIQSLLGEYDYAIQNAKIALTFEPNSVQSYSLIAQCYTKLNEIKVAIDFYKEALNLEPANLDLLLNLSNLYSELGDKQERVRYLVLAHKHFPENTSVSRLLVEGYRDMGRFKVAIKFLNHLKSNTKSQAEKGEIELEIEDIKSQYREQAGFMRSMIYEYLKI